MCLMMQVILFPDVFFQIKLPLELSLHILHSISLAVHWR